MEEKNVKNLTSSKTCALKVKFGVNIKGLRPKNATKQSRNIFFYPKFIYFKIINNYKHSVLKIQSLFSLSSYN